MEAIKSISFIVLLTICISCSDRTNNYEPDTQSNELTLSIIKSSEQFIEFVRYFDLLGKCRSKDDSLFLDSCYKNLASFRISIDEYGSKIDVLISSYDSNSDEYSAAVDDLIKKKVDIMRQALQIVFLGGGRRKVFNEITQKLPYKAMFYLPSDKLEEKVSFENELRNEKVRAYSLFWYVSDAWYPASFPNFRD
ncbi:MAG: hypothetical protein AB7V36_03275 [Bacteroidales bacterium]